MIAETVLSVLSLLRMYQLEADCADPEHWEALAALYEHYGLVSNAAACRRRAEYYHRISSKQIGGSDEQDR